MDVHVAARVATAITSTIIDNQRQQKQPLITSVLVVVGVLLFLALLPLILIVSGGAGEDYAMEQGLVDENGNYIVQHYEGEYGSGIMMMPCPEIVAVSDEFGWRLHPISGDWRLHAGIDLAANADTPVLAAAPGVITYSQFHPYGYGYLVEIDHGKDLVTRYAHLIAQGLPEGTMVEAGDVVGYVGSTGNSTGPHLHFEVRIKDEPVDPRNYIDLGGL